MGENLRRIGKQGTEYKKKRETQNGFDHGVHPLKDMRSDRDCFDSFKKVQKKFKKGVDKHLMM